MIPGNPEMKTFRHDVILDPAQTTEDDGSLPSFNWNQ
jgi:hypothetical protein